MYAVRAENLTKRYGAALALEQGEAYGYLGPNGARKTTTIRLLLGLQRPTAGRAELFGIDAWSDPVRAHRRVAYVAGEPSLWPSLTAGETLEFLARLRGGVDADYRGRLVERFELDTRKKVRALSKGNRQEEANQRVEGVLAQPVGRRRWLGGRVLVALLGVVAISLTAAVFGWAGAASAGADVSLLRRLDAGANALPVALLFLGLAVRAYALAPRASRDIAYGALTVALLWHLVGSLTGAPLWLVDVTPFAHAALSFRPAAAAVLARHRSEYGLGRDRVFPAPRPRGSVVQLDDPARGGRKESGHELAHVTAGRRPSSRVVSKTVAWQKERMSADEPAIDTERLPIPRERC